MESWSDREFACWLAGFFDGEGCVYLNPKAIRSCEVSIASTDEHVIRAIHSRIGIGSITKVVYSTSKWKPKYQYRVRNYRDVLVFLETIRPFLIVKAEKADEALLRAQQVYDERELRRNRNMQILEMSASGFLDREIASKLGVSRSLIQLIRSGKLKVSDCPKRDRIRTREYSERATTKHKAPYPTTSTTVLK